MLDTNVSPTKLNKKEENKAMQNSTQLDKNNPLTNNNPTNPNNKLNQKSANNPQLTEGNE